MMNNSNFNENIFDELLHDLEFEDFGDFQFITGKFTPWMKLPLRMLINRFKHSNIDLSILFQ
jgi:hypothetical protein